MLYKDNYLTNQIKITPWSASEETTPSIFEPRNLEKLPYLLSSKADGYRVSYDYIFNSSLSKSFRKFRSQAIIFRKFGNSRPLSPLVRIEPIDNKNNIEIVTKILP